MRKTRNWIGFIGISGIAIALGAGCSSATPEGDPNLDGRPAKPARAGGDDAVTQADTTGNPGPDCNRRDTPHSTFMAIKHTDQAFDAANGYWRAFPNSGLDATVTSYESKLWSIYHTNGYEYVLKLVGSTQTGLDMKVPQYKPDHVFFGVGIGDQLASPAWILTPPLKAKLPDFRCWDQCQGNAAYYQRLVADGKCTAFKPTDVDYQGEYALATDPASRYNPMVPNELESQQWTCATIIDVGGNVLDFFVLMDEHDPHGDPW